MKAIVPSFIGPRQESTRTSFLKYLSLEVENLEEREAVEMRRLNFYVGFRAWERNKAVNYSNLHF